MGRNITEKDWNEFGSQVNYLFKEIIEKMPDEIFDKCRREHRREIKAYQSIMDTYDDETNALSLASTVMLFSLFSEEFFNRLFKGGKKTPITPCDIYELGYGELIAQNKVLTIDLLQKFYQFIAEIPTKTIIKDLAGVENDEVDLSEEETFNILSGLSIADAAAVLDNLNTTVQLKSELKRIVCFDKDVNLFLQTVICNGIDLSNIKQVCYIINIYSKIYPSVLELIERLKKVENEEDRRKLFQEYTEVVFPTDVSYSTYTDEDLTFLRDLVFNREGLKENFPNFNAFNYRIRNFRENVVLFKNLRLLSTNSHLAAQIDAEIKKNAILRNTYEDMDISDLPTIASERYSVKFFQKFRYKYIADLIIPESVEKNKDSHEYFNGNRWDVPFMVKVYKLLSRQYNLLDDDSQTAISFLYRMCGKYCPDFTPSKIVWHGRMGNLMNLVYFLILDYDSRRNNKISDFFILENGTPKPSKNFLKKPSKLIEEIFSNEIFSEAGWKHPK